jgi:signal transduction histidine kinase
VVTKRAHDHRHILALDERRTVSHVTERSPERWAALAGFVACVSVGVPVALQHLDDQPRLEGPPFIWWANYVVYLVAFAAGDRATHRPATLSPRAWLAVQATTGVTVVALGYDAGWTPVLLVVTAATAAYLLHPTSTAVLIGAQCASVGVIAIAHGMGPTDAAIATVVYGMLQSFAAVTVHGALRESRARAQLGEAHADLRAATVLLADSSRADERLRIARDLHDLIGHQLTALSLELEVASHQAPLPAREHVDRASRIARDLLTGVRAAVGQLRTDTAPLQLALESMARDLPEPRIHVDVDDQLDLESDVTFTLVRCAQEIMTNTARHAGAGNLWLQVSRGPDGSTILRAHDDGQGSSTLRLGNGLTGMCERLRELGGSISFDHAEGFTVTARVPAP